MSKAAANDPATGSWRRARRPEQKEQRRDAILSAARRLLESADVASTTLSAIAREAGLSKANCYRYFESREAILLDLILEEARAWQNTVVERLDPLIGSSDIAGVVEVLVRSTVERPMLCALISSVWSVLERNVGAESVAHFKRSFLALSDATVSSLVRVLPELTEADAHTATAHFFLFVAGAWPAANPPPIVAEVLATDEFAGHHLSFEDALTIHTGALLRGLRSP